MDTLEKLEAYLDSRGDRYLLRSDGEPPPTTQDATDRLTKDIQDKGVKCGAEDATIAFDPKKKHNYY